MISFRSAAYAGLFVVISCNSKPTLNDLSRQIVAKITDLKGTFAVAFKDLDTGEEILINEHSLFHAASTMKTPVLIEVYKQAQEGKFSLQDSLLIKTEFNSIVDSTFSLGPEDDSEKELYTLVGKKRPVSELIYKMIIMSSNLATNILIEVVDAKKVTGTMRELGAMKIQVLRGVEDGKAYRAGLNNQVTAYDLMVIFVKMSEGETVSRQASEEMVKILLDQKFNDIIPAKLPPEVKVAHKTGWITGLHHDGGIIYLPNGKKYVLVLLSSNLEDEKSAVEAMASISEMIYDYEK